ncbi:MAG: hypothetical protein ABL890_00575 [Candidatus Peribacteraceae bacterium]
MNARTSALIAAAAVVAGAILFLQSFDAGKIACPDIADARAELQAQYDTGVNASVEVYAGEQATADEALSRCLNANPKDPCEDLQKARDVAVNGFNDIPSPPDSAPYAEFQTYFAKRDQAYSTYKNAKSALEQCRAANPPKPDVPYEESDSKVCFDVYDASIGVMRDKFTKNTQILRNALQAALAALDAREKACNPPTGAESITDPFWESEEGGTTPTSLLNCRLIDPNWDTELFVLRRRAAALPAEIQAIQDSIENIDDRMDPLERDLRDVDTYIPPESAKSQYEGAMNAKRAERKISIEFSLDYYRGLLQRRQVEKVELEQELSAVQAKIAARLAQIEKENQARKRAFPTNIHLSGPDKCEFYHCHGTLCGRPDPVQDGCGHGTTTQDDVECKNFIETYLKAAGV